MKLMGGGRTPPKTQLQKTKLAYVHQLYKQLQEQSAICNTKLPKMILDKYGEISMSVMYNAAFNRMVDKSVNITANEIVSQMIKGQVYKDGMGLSSRLWHSVNASGQKIEDAITSCLARGIGSAEASKIITQFATTGHHTWDRKKIREKLGNGYAQKYGTGGLDYEALRLMRTTTTHMAQLSAINSHKVNPYSNYVIYHTGHAGSRTCSMCKERDGKKYKLDEVPLDHPNGLCWLEPFLSVDGKNPASLSDLMDDMNNYYDGKPNSGLMDKWVKENGGTPVKPKPATAKPKPTKEKPKPDKPKPAKAKPQPAAKKPKPTKAKAKSQPVKTKPAPAKAKPAPVTKKPQQQKNSKLPKGHLYTPEQREQIYKELETKLTTNITRMLEEEYKDDENKARLVKFYLDPTVKGMIGNLQKYPLPLQDLYLHTVKELKMQLPDEDEGAHYHPMTRSIYFSVRAVNRDKRGAYGTVFHEWGHLIDNQFAKRKVITKSLKEEMYKTLQKDVDNRVDYHMKKYGIGKRDAKKAISDELCSAHDAIAGVSDIYGGITNNQVMGYWGHEKYYWNRRDKKAEVCSEAWADILQSYGIDKQREYVEKYLPESRAFVEKTVEGLIEKMKKGEI